VESKKPFWQQKYKVAVKNQWGVWMQNVEFRPEKHFLPFKFDPDIQDGVIIQKDAQKRKEKMFAAKWPIFNEFQKTFLCFVCPTSVHKT
jgi:hypothetical protein